MARTPKDDENPKTETLGCKVSPKQKKKIRNFAKKLKLSVSETVTSSVILVEALGVNPIYPSKIVPEKYSETYNTPFFLRGADFFHHSHLNSIFIQKSKAEKNIQIFSTISQKIQSPLNKYLTNDPFRINESIWENGYSPKDLLALKQFSNTIKILCSSWYPACQMAIEPECLRQKLPIEFVFEKNAYFQILHVTQDKPCDFLFCSDINVLFVKNADIPDFVKLFEVCGGSDLALYYKAGTKPKRIIYGANEALIHYHLYVQGWQNEFDTIRIIPSPFEIDLADTIEEGSFIIKTPNFPFCSNTLLFKKEATLSNPVSLYVKKDFLDKHPAIAQAFCSFFITEWNRTSTYLYLHQTQYYS